MWISEQTPKSRVVTAFYDASNRKEGPPDESTPPGCFDAAVVRVSHSVMFQPHQRAVSDPRRLLAACCLHRCATLISLVMGKSIIHGCYCLLRKPCCCWPEGPAGSIHPGHFTSSAPVVMCIFPTLSLYTHCCRKLRLPSKNGENEC